MALAMVVSPVAMAVGGTAGASEATETGVEADDLDAEDVQTQDAEDVSIDSTLEREARGGDTVEVFVRMDAKQSSFASATTATAETTQATLEQEAAQTQAALETYAADTPGVDILNEFWIANAALVEVDTSRASIDELATIDGVIHLHENFEVTSDSTSTAESADELTPSDEREAVSADREPGEPGEYEYTYGLEQINVPEVWDGLDVTGQGASVAVLDTGLDADHPEFEGFDAENNWAHFNETGHITGDPPTDADGHGTHVAGTVAGGNESGTHIGVAPDTELYAGAVIPDGSGEAAQVLGGMQWAVEQDVDVMSMSLGAAGHRDLYLETIANAHADGTILVASAGNEQEGTTSSPGNDPLSVSVGASNPSLGIASFSSGELVDTATEYGYSAGTDWPEQYILPDVSAPGVSVLSAYPDGEYEHLPGTSMAAPHVSGVVALMVAENPDLTIDEIKNRLVESAEKPPAEIATPAAEALDGQDTRYGHGIVDAYHAVSSVSNDSESVTVSVVDDGGEPMPDVPVDVIGESDVAMSSFTNASGDAEYELAHGEYTVTATEFGYSTPDRTVTVDGTSDTVELSLEPNVDATLLADQPHVVGANETLQMVDTEVVNLQNYTVDVTDSSIGSDAIEGVTVLNTTDPADPQAIASGELGETLHVADEANVTAYDGYLGVAIETGAIADADPALELEHTFNGTGEDVTVTTGPSETLAAPEPANITMDAELDDTIEAGDGVEPAVTITNEGDQTADVPIDYLIGGASLRLDVVTIEGGETYQSTYPVVGIHAAFGAGNFSQAIMAGSEMEQNTLTIQAAGDVTGTVTNAEGEPIEGVEIRLVDIDAGKNIAQPTTDENGTFHVDVGDRAPTEWYMTVEHPQYGLEEVGTPFAGVPSTTDGSEQVIDVEMAAGATYTVPVDGGQPTPIGFPGDTEGTVGDVLPDDTEGVVWAFDSATDEWTRVAADDDIEPLDAMVVTTNDDQVAQIDFEGPAGEVDTPSPGEAQLDEGWNFIAPSQHADVSEVFDGSADPSSFLDVYDDAESPMTFAEDIDRPAFSLPGETVENATVNPFSGYFVYANDDGTIPSYVYDGATQSETNDILNIDTETIDGTVVGEISGEPIETATVGLDTTTLGTFTNTNGEYVVEEVPAGTEQTVFAEASGYQTETVTATAGDEGIEFSLLETTYFTHNSSDVPDAVGQGEEFTVTAEIDNDGAESGDAEIQLRIGQNVTADEGTILQDDETFVVDVVEQEIGANETGTVELTEEIRSFHPTGEQNVAIVTDDEIAEVGTITIE
ncbi:subtilisin-like serine protease [Halovivax asiaticus JCM 14624]|uniref:Subtilisin-like serine protease n=2 Tax=Halovivax asiaticus TaxID=332953 RepID=M0BIG3_9EURY|nr:subtilisin-like serine protease [Halovivax asiaticus JCM 14624]